MAGVDWAGIPEIRTPNTRCFGISRIRCSGNCIYEKGSSISARALEYGRGGEIRTPNTRIWNPLLCQLELHP